MSEGKHWVDTKETSIEDNSVKYPLEAEKGVTQHTAYQTTDGKLFLKEIEAISHEAKVRLWESFKQYFPDELPMSYTEFCQWLHENENNMRCYVGDLF